MVAGYRIYCRLILIGLLGVSLAVPARLRADEADLGKYGRLLGTRTGGTAGLAFSADGLRLVSGEDSGVVTMWDVITGKVIREFKDDKGFVRWAKFSPDRKMLAASGHGNEVFLWDVETGKEIKRLAGHKNGGRDGLFTADGKRLITSGFDEMIRAWDVASGKMLWEVRGHPRVPYSLTLSPDEKLLVSGGDNETALHLWDPVTGKQLRSIETQHTKCIYCVVFSPNGKLLASSGADETIRILELASGKCVQELHCKPGETEQIHNLSFSHDGRLLISAQNDGNVRLWEIASGQEALTLGHHKSWAWDVAISPTLRHAASTGHDGRVVLYDLEKLLRPEATPTELSPRALEELWADLRGADAQRAYRAVALLSANADRFVPFLKDRLQPDQPPKPVDPKQVKRWIEALDSDSFEEREHATRQLDQLGETVGEALRAALKKDPPLEAKRRLETLIEKLDRSTPSPEELRQLRVLQVLEDSGSPEARRLLEKLARGDGSALLTREAAQVLERLKRQPSR